LIFGSIPTRNPGNVAMPSLLLRWGLLFVSGVFVPLAEMAPVARALAYLSPLTYAQDLTTTCWGWVCSTPGWTWLCCS